MEKVLEHGDHTLQNQKLFVCRPPPEETRDNEERAGEEEGTQVDDEQAVGPDVMPIGGNAILVEGMKSNVDKEVIEMFFESKKRSGGGEINQIKTYQKSGRAIIWFAEAESKFL